MVTMPDPAPLQVGSCQQRLVLLTLHRHLVTCRGEQPLSPLLASSATTRTVPPLHRHHRANKKPFANSSTAPSTQPNPYKPPSATAAAGGRASYGEMSLKCW